MAIHRRYGAHLSCAALATLLALVVSSPSSSARRTFPGEPGRIVFSGQGTLLWSVRSDGSGLRRLASQSPSDQTETWPSFSPDGQKIAFIRGLGNTTGRVIIARSDGQEQRRIFTGAYAAEWSPDGSELAVIGSDRGTVLIMRADGSHRRSIKYRLHNLESLSWSPDGSRLALAGAPPGIYTGCCLYTAAPNSSSLRLIAEDSDIFWPDWSPDARRIAYQTTIATSRGTLGPLTIVGADGSDKQRFGTGSHPAWSPDGSQVAFGYGGIWALEVATGSTRRVTKSEASAGIDWQPLCTRRGGAGRDILRGGAGADLVCGLRGNDTIFGGRGSDRLFGEEGNDRLFARDGAFDVIGCGSGHDRAVVDRRDFVGRDCERVRRF